MYRAFKTQGRWKVEAVKKGLQDGVKSREQLDVCVYVCVCERVTDLSLVKLDQGWSGSVAAVVQDQIGQDGQSLLI